MQFIFYVRKSKHLIFPGSQLRIGVFSFKIRLVVFGYYYLVNVV